MFNRKEAKKLAKLNLKQHYLIFVIACLIAAFIGSAYTSSYKGLEATSPTEKVVENLASNGNTSIERIDADTVLTLLIEGNDKKAENVANEIEKDLSKNEIKIGPISLGNGKGILSSVINKMNSGTFLVVLFQAINSIMNSKTIAMGVFIAIVAIVYLVVMTLFKNMYSASFRRVFLEGQNYKKVKINRFLFLMRVKKGFKAAFTIFMANLFSLLWSLTIVGGFIKYYAYYLVPYIVAENPDVSYKEAIKLSSDMMEGHKMECFKLELSFLGWYFLSAFTFGISSMLFSNPYQECTMVQYYKYLRQLGYENKIENITLLNDKYLFEKAPEELIKETYADVYEIMNDDIHIEDCMHTGVRGFFENNFGIIAKYDEDEDRYNTAIEQEVKIRDFKYILALEAYPGRLFPIPEEDRNKKLESSHYLRHYSIASIVALFFIFSFIGWSWEVSLHLIKDGVFVNRGVMHGPWLPIYGSGGALILVLLYRLRSKPALHIIATIVLCGILEYTTSWVLEVTKGTQWWNYSGYFLNINGRICAEGLLVFALGGTAIVYGLAPIIDNNLRKANQKVLAIICTILLVIFSIDAVYSNFYPNTGKGITDYDTTAYVQIERYYQ